MWPFSSSNVAVVSQKRTERDAALASNSQAVAEGQGIYLRVTGVEIVERIGKGEWTASEVLEAYISRAIQAQATTNCLTEVLFDFARARAAELDKQFASTKQLKGPLHGIPFSIKDQFEIVGFDATIGFTQWANRPATKNANIVQQLLDAGAVPFVKTNVPQTMLAFECSNPLWGRTTNPYNANFTCGGSSGGEGALLAMDGSAIGIGSDIGGSLRIPAAYCGIYSLKPASGRISYEGARGPVKGFEAVASVAGPMGRSVKDLEIVSRVTFGAQTPNNSLPPVPFREVNLPKKLRFGFYTSDNYAKASPACKRAVLETVEGLRKAGHECVEIELPHITELFKLFPALTAADGYKTLLSHLGPDKKEDSLFLVTLGASIPNFLRRFVTWALETFVGDKIFAETMRATKPHSVGDFWKLVAQKNEFISEFYEKIWAKEKLDGIIAPVQALPQLPHGGCNNFSIIAVGTIVYNLLDMPVGCLPVTRVDPKQDQLTDEWTKGPGLGSQLIENGLYRGKKPLYDPEASKGMPVNIQIVGKKWEEEKVLAMMEVVDCVLGKDRGFGPGAWDAFVKGA